MVRRNRLVILAALVLGVIIGCGSLYYFGLVRGSDHYLVPEGYQGWVIVAYRDPSCAPLPWSGPFRQVVIPGSGRACTSDAPSYGLKSLDYFYMRPDGSTVALPFSSRNEEVRRIWGETLDERDRFYFFVGTKEEFLRNQLPPIRS